MLNLQHESTRTIETFNFSENAYFASKENQIVTKKGQLITPDEEVGVLFKFKNLIGYDLSVNPIVSILRDEEPIDNQTLEPFIVTSNHNREDIARSFQIGPSGLNRAIFLFSIWNNTDKMKFIDNFTSGISYEVAPSSDRMQNDSIFIATGALLITSTIGATTVVFTYLGHKASLRDQRFATTDKVFDLLSGGQNKKRWKKLHDWYWESKEKHEKKVILKDSIKKPEVSQMKENLNKTGALYYAGLVDRKLLMDIYGGIIIRLYKVLEDDIKDDRRTNPEASKYTEKMYEDACKYWMKKMKKYGSSSCPEPFPKDEYPW